MEGKVNKMKEARFRFQVEFQKHQKQVEESLQKKGKRENVERLVNTWEVQLASAVSKNNIFSLHAKI